ncbi:IPT/TIG domain-containing protein [Geomonas sp.]|uniref:IPT/TIG domain-containing protein n=1 Tax=Geomonas sp. TaxID=2651584 RepID=UPI002B4984F6|nr:IPT/TIG domain-containing protein [Geomonas sp.]HJV36510.1 IPT/TIG domain-containing protein [Geomonas sp.]
MFRHLLNALLLCVLFSVAALAQGAPPATATGKLPPLTILSIIPAQGEPGTAVSVNGTGFTAATSVFLGSRQVPAAASADGRLLSFELPELPAGAYALYMKREDGTTTRAFNFTLLSPTPTLTTLSPSTVVACSSGREREVVVSGTNFQTGSRVLFDGAAIAGRFISPTAIAFLAPQVPSGLHQVQVVNPPNTASGALALLVDGKPEILNITIGADHVVYYDMVINGRNFFSASTLVANGVRVTTAQAPVGEQDQILFRGCSQIIYQRHPYDSTPRPMMLQIVNPNGDESEPFAITAP